LLFVYGGSFADAQTTLSGQALKAIFKMNQYLYKFTNITVQHKLQLFDKLVTPILNYGSEVWGFQKADAIERTQKSIGGKENNTKRFYIW